MSLRSRITTPEENGGRGEDGHLVASYRAKLLQEIDLAEMSSLAAAERRARLERCRRDLADPALAGETILAIATRWGLHDRAHFSRLFRAAYGCSPREYRLSAST